MLLEIERANPEAVRFALRQFQPGGPVYLEARRGEHCWTILHVTTDGDIELTPGVARELGLKLDANGRIVVAPDVVSG